MKKNLYALGKDANTSINKARSLYAGWAKKNRISYYELLILSLLREEAPCTQAQISEICGLPKQTVSRITNALAKAGHLAVCQKPSNKKEKEVSLTKDGMAYAEELLAPLRQMEQRAIRQMGAEQYQQFLDLTLLYRHSLEAVIRGIEYGDEIT